MRISTLTMGLTFAFVTAGQVHADDSKQVSPPHQMAPKQICEGLLCHLTPNSMAKPMSAEEAAVLKDTAPHPVLLGRSPPKRVRTARRFRRQLLALATPRQSEKPKLTDDRTTPRDRYAIFSLFDPVVNADDYRNWLRRVPSTTATAARSESTPSFAKN